MHSFVGTFIEARYLALKSILPGWGLKRVPSLSRRQQGTKFRSCRTGSLSHQLVACCRAQKSIQLLPPGITGRGRSFCDWTTSTAYLVEQASALGLPSQREFTRGSPSLQRASYTNLRRA